ncbi:hypothetical protein K435DRAFT_698199, partial [Dendrothele bispora CBS 962.96]
MYLLDNPDHYTSHKFKPFHWNSFKKGKIFGLSRVYDYVYRPLELENMSLYDWIRCCERVKIPTNGKNYKPKKNSDSLIDPEMQDYDSETEYDQDTDTKIDTNETEPESQDDANATYQKMTDDTPFPTPAAKKNLPRNIFPFVYGHPLADSHAVELSTEDKRSVPNFIGPGLPRRNKGDHEYYCMTMLVFFKPWRSGKDLKTINESWDECFTTYKFSDRACNIMNNFQLKYECLDARDDFNA